MFFLFIEKNQLRLLWFPPQISSLASHKLSKTRKFSYTWIFLSWSLTHRNWISNSHIQMSCSAASVFLLLALVGSIFYFNNVNFISISVLASLLKPPRLVVTWVNRPKTSRKCCICVTVHIEMKLISIAAVSKGAADLLWLMLTQQNLAVWDVMHGLHTLSHTLVHTRYYWDTNTHSQQGILWLAEAETQFALSILSLL